MDVYLSICFLVPATEMGVNVLYGLAEKIIHVSSQLKVSSGLAPSSVRIAGMACLPKSADTWFASPPFPQRLLILRSCLRQNPSAQLLEQLKLCARSGIFHARTPASSFNWAYVKVPCLRTQPTHHFNNSSSNASHFPPCCLHLYT